MPSGSSIITRPPSPSPASMRLAPAHAPQQRGWTVVAEYPSLQDGVITLLAYEDACMKKIGADMGPVG